MVGHHMNWPPFPHKFRLIQLKNSAPWYVEDNGDHLAQVNQFDIEREIASYFALNPETSGLAMTPKDCSLAFEYWERLAPKLTEEIAAVRFKSDPGFTWRRLPFDPAPAQTPTFDELMHRTENAQIVKAWIGSLFDTMSDRQQYLWLYGRGENGKSRFASFLGWIFGDATGGGEPPRSDDRFWASSCIGKRLMIFPDCDKIFFINSGQFKSATGDDLVRIEEKGRPAFTAKLHCKFLILSNEKPHVDGGHATLRRIIYCKIADFEGAKMNPHDYEALLQSEAPAIVHQCLEQYQLMCPNRGQIPILPEMQSELLAFADERWEVIAKRWLNLYDKDLLAKIPYNQQEYVTSEYTDLLRRMEGLRDVEYRRFREFLERKYGVSYRYVRPVGGSDEDRFYAYTGCSEKPRPPECGLIDRTRQSDASKVTPIWMGHRKDTES